ncbi:hypothetical protein ACQPZF_19770 [Actinosynnema sp. CS-041913]|uniref:hypothetical protein n=1 Tax=Actinosynnema sp. CS-041913 TaxID=3239917 RepID=UPI003D8CB0F9
MKRVIAIMAAAVAALGAVTGTANAATGTIMIGDKDYENPSGCLKIEVPSHGQKRPFVYNNTDKDVLVYKGLECEGKSVATVKPRRGGEMRVDSSVKVE